MLANKIIVLSIATNLLEPSCELWFNRTFFFICN